MTNKQLRELIERLYANKRDYDEGKVQDFGVVCGDCWWAAKALETLMIRGEKITADFEALYKYHREQQTPDTAANPLYIGTRRSFLERAAECVCGHREQDYGSPEDNFATIADLWTAYSEHVFDAVDVAMMMALLKIARIRSGHGSDDSFIDLAGYAACGGEIAAKRRAEHG